MHLCLVQVKGWADLSVKPRLCNSSTCRPSHLFECACVVEASPLANVSESLRDLMDRRMRELQASSLLALYRRAFSAGGDHVTYETIRKLYNGEQLTTRDQAITDLADLIEVEEATIREAMQVPPTFGPWKLPEQALTLTQRERQVVDSVIKALIDAKRTGGSSDGRRPEAEKSGEPGEAGAEVYGFSSGRRLDGYVTEAATEGDRTEGLDLGPEDPS